MIRQLLPSRICLIVGTLSVCSSGMAQLSDVKLRADLTFGLQQQELIRLRDITPLGRFSTLGIQGTLPIGLRVQVSQRLSNFREDAETDGFDEYFVEDIGSWRIGKQYMPFGGGTLFRETLLAVRVDSNLIFEGIPIAVAITDQGKDRQFGAVGRIGSRGLGVSAAVGRHFGINRTAFAVIDAPFQGLGQGWGLAYGFDWNRRFGRISARVESVALRNGNGSSVDRDFADVFLNYDLGSRHSIGAGLTQEIGNPNRMWRIQGVYTAQKGVQLESYFRQSQLGFVDFSVFLRLRF